MARLDRYLLSQLLVLFGFFSLILVMIYWINRAVSLFDRLIADGQTAWVFLELTSLSLPGIIRIVLPLSAFVAALYVTNRMASESELTVVQATGYSPFRLARPVAFFGVIVFVLMSILSHLLVPLSLERLGLRNAEISQNMTARLLTPGQFLTPSEGVTFYIRDMSPEGEMLDLFLSETTEDGDRIAYTASSAYLVRSERGPQLVMLSGLVQTLELETNRLLTTRFEDFAYDVSGFIDATPSRRINENTLTTWALLFPSQATLDATSRAASELRLEAHIRFADAALGFVAGLLGFSALLVGGFSRFGLWRHMLFAVGLVVFVKIIETSGASVAQNDPDLWVMVHLGNIAGLMMAVGLLMLASRPYAFKRKPQAMPLTTKAAAP